MCTAVPIMNVDGALVICKTHASRMIHAKDMTLIWDKDMLHSASKSRKYFTNNNTILTREDMSVCIPGNEKK